MNNKLVAIITAIFTFFLGVWGTVMVIKYIPEEETQDIQENVQQVNITESDTIAPSVEKVYDAVVTVENYTNSLSAIGTGFVYKTDDLYGYILTNNHVISGAKSLKVLNNNGDLMDATLLGCDEYADLAVLRVDKSFVLKVATIGDSSKIKIGDTVFTVGTPVSLTYAGTVTKGIVSATNRTVDVTLNSGGDYMMDVIQITATINPGNSGGPLVNINGEVIGINTLKLVDDEIEGMGFSIPIEMATAVVKRLEAGETIERPYLGIVSISANNAYQLYRYGVLLDKEYESGIAIYNIEENSAASTVGLKKGDVILKIDDYEIKDTAYFRYILYKYNVGDTVTITYEREGVLETVQVQLSKNA